MLAVTAATGAAGWRQYQGRGPDVRAAAAEAAAGVRGMTPVGDPIPAEKGRRWSQAVTADGRVYAAADDDIAGSWVVAVDARTGRKLWTSAKYGAFWDYGGPIAFPGGLLLKVEGLVHVLDPATGKLRWTLDWEPNDELVVDGETLVRVFRTGAAEGYDLASGRRLWSAGAGADRPVHSLGMQTGDYDEVRVSFGMARITIADDDMVQVTKGGRVRVREMRTGKVLRTVEAGLPGATSVSAYRGRVFTAFQDNDGNPWQLRVTDLNGGGKARVLYSRPIELESRKFGPCGADRICLGVYDDFKSETAAVLIDIAKGTTVTTAMARFQVPAAADGRTSGVLISDVATSELFDTSGRLLLAERAAAWWIDDRDVLWQVYGDEQVTLSAVSTGTGRKTELATIAGRLGSCALDSALLACAVSPAADQPSELRVWRFAR
ncbi:hypothetical protein Adi01nite_00770 [Amorphoplanes digitatis]|nr:hypothetical protein Adi01nite_00770 [Actinoplanes digitatis]